MVRSPSAIREGHILNGPTFNKPMLVETVRSNGAGEWGAGLAECRALVRACRASGAACMMTENCVYLRNDMGN